ncbi:solute carrier family 39, member 1/2/3 [Lipomyces tetrasporus]
MKKLYSLLYYAVLVTAQRVYTGCHQDGNILYCVDESGLEVPLTTYLSPSLTSSGSAVATTTAGSSSVTNASTAIAVQTTVVSDCHLHGTETFCMDGNNQEVLVQATGSKTGEPPAQFTGCQAHGDEKFCFDPDGDEVHLLPVEDSSEHGDANEGHDDEETSTGENCHFHAGVEHCLGGDDNHSSSSRCTGVERDYNIPYRIGSIFVILATSAIAVFGPILWASFFNPALEGHVFTLIKQFGTGVMIATAMIHLLTHSQLMFSNQCLGVLEYEATATAIAMAGIFTSFIVEYFGNRIVESHNKKSPLAGDAAGNTEPIRVDKGQGEVVAAVRDLHNHRLTGLGHQHGHSLSGDSKLNVGVMEAGVVFHSIIVGLTLVVAGDSGFTTLFIVVIFHQMFEGLALGARIAGISKAYSKTVSKFIMAAVFALITPIGMAIGLGIIHQFNGNDEATLWTIGTLDALSAGVLLWAALVSMLTHDWFGHGYLRRAGLGKIAVGLCGLVAGMTLMGLLGKWA